MNIRDLVRVGMLLTIESVDAKHKEQTLVSLKHFNTKIENDGGINLLFSVRTIDKTLWHKYIVTVPVDKEGQFGKQSIQEKEVDTWTK